MLKLNIGFNRKVGEANYSSRGASVNLEIEVESGLVREPDKLKTKIDYLFGLAQSSVDTQLNGNGHLEPVSTASARPVPQATPAFCLAVGTRFHLRSTSHCLL